MWSRVVNPQHAYTQYSQFAQGPGRALRTDCEQPGTRLDGGKIAVLVCEI